MCRSSSTHSGHSTRQQLCVVNTLPQVNFLTTQWATRTKFSWATAPRIHGRHLHRCVHHHQHEGATDRLQLRRASGYVFGLGQIIWTKKVVDLNTSQVLYNGSGVFSGVELCGR
jgi:hypothetical protein